MCVNRNMLRHVEQVTVMQVKATSPLTHNISGTAKAAAQVGVAHNIVFVSQGHKCELD